MRWDNEFRQEVTSLALWFQKNWTVLVFLFAALYTLMLFIVFLCWMLGYWLNALAGFHFELSSCWQGVALVLSGYGTVFIAGYSAWKKQEGDNKRYDIDSTKNSQAGTMPAIGIANTPHGENK